MMSGPGEVFSFEKDDKYSLLDNFLYYGLFVGAFFQLACILSVVFIPKSESERVHDNEVSENNQGSSSTPKHEQQNSRRSTKHERKKRR